MIVNSVGLGYARTVRPLKGQSTGNTTNNTLHATPAFKGKKLTVGACVLGFFVGMATASIFSGRTNTIDDAPKTAKTAMQELDVNDQGYLKAIINDNCAEGKFSYKGYADECVTEVTHAVNSELAAKQPLDGVIASIKDGTVVEKALARAAKAAK